MKRLLQYIGLIIKNILNLFFSKLIVQDVVIKILVWHSKYNITFQHIFFSCYIPVFIKYNIFYFFNFPQLEAALHLLHCEILNFT